MKKSTVSRMSLVIALLALVWAAPLVQAAETGCDGATRLASSPDASYVFEGCWAYFPAGPCYDVYLDSGGNYWICRQCGQTTNPGSNQCSRITLQTLNTGYWCS